MESPRPGLSARDADERRQLTVLFCDLVGSTALAERLDPEDLQHLVRLYQEWAVEILERHGGRVAQYLGDGILVYFGYPRAREDSTTRAVRAALELVQHLSDLSNRLERTGSTRASIRVGIHTGLVVVGRMGTADRSERLALGETPNVAARLQALAEPDTVLVSEATHRLTHHQFAFDALGLHSLRGLSRPVGVYRALREEAASSTPRTPMVNRHDEISWLEERLARAREGDGRRLLMAGEAGLGKSRLLTHLRERTEAGEGSTLWVEVACSVQYRTSPLYPLLGALARTLGLRRADDEDTRLRKIEETLRAQAPGLEQAPSLFALLFGLPADDAHVLELTPSLRRARTLETLVRWFVTLADLHTLVLVVEDVQWSDPSTLEWLEALLLRVPEHPLLVIATQRTDSGSGTTALRDVEILHLEPLERRHVLELVDGVAGNRQLPASVLAHLIDKADGVPLFVEELTRDILEAEPVDGAVGVRSIPSTLQDSLMARLDRLGPDKELAQWAAVLGREFPHEWLAAVTSGTEVLQGLERLIDAGILEARGTPPRAVYQFRHALLQDAAYGSLLRRHRRRRHRRVADVLEEHFPQDVAKRPEELAHHATEARDFERAAWAWRAAGDQAVGRSALREAEMHLSRGLMLVDELPDDDRRAELELGLRRLLGSALLAAHGYADQQVEINYQRARELGRKMGPSRELFDALRGLHPFFLVRAQHGEARELARQLLELARELDNEDLEIEARLTLATSSYWVGDVGTSLDHADTILALYDGERHGEHTSIYGQDPAVLAQVYSGWCHAWLGRPATAMEVSCDAVQQARILGHPHTLVMALDHFCVLHQHVDETEGVQALIDECRRLSTRYGFAMWSAMASFRQGWLDGRSAAPEEGFEHLRSGLAAFETTGARIAQPLHWAYLADTCRRAGRIDEGLEAVGRAREALEAFGERQWEPELPRLEGELLALRHGPTPEIEARFRRALELARTLGSGLLELRAALSLARLLHERGEPGAAGAVLQPAYDAMERSFETPDLSAARILLSSLSTVTSGRSR